MTRDPLDRGAAHAAEVVLIVDDVPDNVAVLHDALDEAGYTVLVATDGPSAIHRARQARPAIVLLDARMPGMDGFEVARRLKADPAESGQGGAPSPGAGLASSDCRSNCTGVLTILIERPSP